MAETSASPASPRTATCLGAAPRAGLVLSFLAWVLCFLLPAAATLLALLWVIGVLLTATAVLRTGGFALPLDRFAASEGIAVLVALGCLAGEGVRWWAGRRPLSQPDERQRVIGPGGRVLRVLYTPRQGPTGEPRAPMPSPVWLLWIGWYLVYRLIARDTRTLAGPCTVLSLAALYAVLGYAGAHLLALAFRLGRWVLRTAQRSEYRAGMATALLIVLSLPGGAALLMGDRRELQPASPLAEAVFAEAESGRAWLFGVAEVLRPAQALREDLRRYGAPLLERARLEPLAELSLWPPGPRYAGLGVAYEPEVQIGSAEECQERLFTGELPTVERRLRAKYRQLAADDVHGVALEALLIVCSQDVPGSMQRLGYRLWERADHDALDEVRKEGRRRRLLVERYAPDEEAGCTLGLEPEPVRLRKERALFQRAWNRLTDLEQAVLYERIGLGEEYDTIAAEYPQSRGRLRDLVHNAVAKVQKRLQPCRTPWERLVDQQEREEARRRRALWEALGR